MPRRTPRIPSYRCNKTSARAVVTIDGKDYWLGKYGSDESRDRYNRLIAEWLTNGHRMSITGRPDLAVVELCAAYWRHAEAHYSSEHLHKVRSALRPFRRLYGSTRVSDFGPLALQTVQHDMVATGLARTTVNGLIGIVRRVFKWGVAHELVPADIYHALQAVSGLRRGRTEAREPVPVKPVLQAHIDAVLPYVSRQVRGLIDVQLLTGARPGELVVMRPIDLNTQDVVWIYNRADHKTAHRGHNRTIFVGPRAQALIRRFLQDRPVSSYLFSPREAESERWSKARTHRRVGQKPAPPKTSRRVGDHYTVNSYRQAIQRVCEKVGVPKWHPHQLRHNAATVIRREEGIEVARIILGHRSSGITEIYAEQDHSKAVAVIRRIG